MMSSMLKMASLVVVLDLTAMAQDVRGILINRIDKARQAVGIVAGRIGPGGREVVGYGRLAKSTAQSPGGDTLFELASITKVFTSLALADMVERGEVRLDDPVARFLPADFPVPTRNGRQITLLNLSMHTAGLGSPRLMKGFDPSRAGGDLGLAALRAYLSSVPLARDPGEKYEYSNYGVELLGRALAFRAGLSYEDMIRKRILGPLGMTSTAITLSADQNRRLAKGHDPTLKAVPSTSTSVLVAAGALRSTANDLLKFLAANLELTDTPLKAAMRRMRSVRKPIGIRETDVAMAWHITNKHGSDIFWHNGGVAGYKCWVGFDPKTRKGAVVLCNTRTDIDDIGFHLVDERYELTAPQSPRPRGSSAIGPTRPQAEPHRQDLKHQE